jgi:hypothetical protein
VGESKELHARSSINHICVISTDDPCVQEMMWIRRNNRTFHIISKEHDIAMGCPWVNDVRSTLNIISGKVEPNKLVVVYAVILQKHGIGCTSVGAMK